MKPSRVALCVLVAMALSSAQAWAEKKSVAYVTKPGTVVSRAVNAGPRPGHELIQQVRNDTTSSADEDWNGTTVTTSSQQDVTAGSGTISGYAVRTHKNGDQTFYKYRGNISATGDGPARQITGDGVIEVTGGTGKFANARGGGTWNSGKGQANIRIDIEY